MTRQRDRGRSTILLLLISLVVGYVTTYTVISFNSALSSPVQNVSTNLPPPEPQSEPQSEPLSEGSFLAVNGNSNCRQVLDKSFPLYATPGQTPSYLQTVNSGQQVGLLNGTSTVLGEDGLRYIYVSVPYGSQSSTLGYMQSQVQDASNGETQSTLALCSNSSESSNNTSNNNSGSNNSGDPIGAYW